MNSPNINGCIVSSDMETTQSTCCVGTMCQNQYTENDGDTKNQDGQYNWWGIEEIVASCVVASEQTDDTQTHTHTQEPVVRTVELSRHNWWSASDE